MALDPRLPSAVKVGGLVYQVIPVPNCELPNRKGRARHYALEIEVDDTQPVALQLSTLLHEILHAVSEHNHLDLSERTVTQLEFGLFQALADNDIRFYQPEEGK